MQVDVTEGGDVSGRVRRSVVLVHVTATVRKPQHDRNHRSRRIEMTRGVGVSPGSTNDGLLMSRMVNRNKQFAGLTTGVGFVLPVVSTVG